MEYIADTFMKKNEPELTSLCFGKQWLWRTTDSTLVGNLNATPNFQVLSTEVFEDLKKNNIADMCSNMSFTNYLAKVIQAWCEEHVGQIAPSDICIKFTNEGADIIELVRIKDPILGGEVEPLSNGDADKFHSPPSDYHYYAECVFPDYVGYEG